MALTVTFVLRSMMAISPLRVCVTNKYLNGLP